MNTPSVAIVILNYNGSSYLQKFLPFVLASTYANKRIIVADNASSDDSIEILKTQFPQVEVIINKQNDGFAGGYNWALKKIEADYFVLLNSDVEVTPNWIEPIIELMENDKTIAACQPKLLAYNNRNMFEYAGASGGFIDFLGYPFSRGRIFDVLEEDKQQYNNSMPIFWATGAAMFIKANVFKDCNGFDERFFAHQEEIDLCWRIQLKGYKIYVCPASVVYHVGAGTLPRGGRKVYLNFRNNLWMLSKNLPVHEKLWKLPFRFILDGISAWKGLLNGDKDFFIAIYKAHKAVVKSWITSSIVSSDNRKSFSSLYGVHKKSIVWKHFVKGIKTFDEIIKN
ncbi:MAG: glycosyltransferase family 2 protein [Chitinophagaceae bacterium]